MLKRAVSAVLITSFCWTQTAAAQSGSAAAAAAGASLAGSATSAGAAASTSAASAPGGASSAPIEVQIMVYGGLKQIAKHIAHDTAVALKKDDSANNDEERAKLRAALDTEEAPWKCNDSSNGSLLLQDSTSSAQIALYKTFNAYFKTLSSDYDVLIKILSDQQKAETDKQKQELENLQQQLKQMQDNLGSLQEQLRQQSGTRQTFRPGALDLDLGNLHQMEQQVASMRSSVGTMQAATPADTGGTTGTGSGTGSGGGSSATPASLQYLSGVGAEVTAAKQSMSYASSSVQALNQALNTELAKDLCQHKIQLRTATSTLNLDDAADDIADKWKTLQKDSGDLSRLMTWLQRPAKDPNGTTTPTKPVKDPNGTTTPTKPVPPTARDLIATSDGVVLGTSLSNAMAALQTWMTSGDQMGGIILTDILKGAQLFKDFGEKKFPALQVSIDAAGGNTRTNSFPLLNFFYLPKPSFNAGVVVTFELRDEANNFLAGDTQKVLYAYSKWKPSPFCMDESVDTVELDTGRQVKGPHQKCRTVATPPSQTK
jgi:hypothetical protein